MSRSQNTRAANGIRPEAMEQSAWNLLHFLLLVKICLIVISLTFVTIALLSDDETLFLRTYTNRRILINGGICLGLVSAVTGLANILALFGIHHKKRILLVPYISCLLFGAMFSFLYLVGTNLMWGFQDQHLVVLMILLSTASLLLRLVPVYMVLEHSCLVSPTVSSPAPASISLSIEGDSPPQYESLDCHLPGYEDDIVNKEAYLLSNGSVTTNLSEKL